MEEWKPRKFKVFHYWDQPFYWERIFDFAAFYVFSIKFARICGIDSILNFSKADFPFFQIWPHLVSIFDFSSFSKNTYIISRALSSSHVRAIAHCRGSSRPQRISGDGGSGCIPGHGSWHYLIDSYSYF